MLEIPLNAKVNCVDGHAGKSTHVIVDPRQRVVTHVVVKDDKSFAALDWLVPIAHIAGSTHDQIRLDCTLAELAKMTPFSSTHYVDYGSSESYDNYTMDYMPMSGPYAVPTAPVTNIPMLDEAIPGGERAIRQDAKVEATDGTAGTVGELLIDGDTGAITHFTLKEGHFWDKKEVMLPLSAVDHSEEDVVYLKLDKKGIKSLAAVPRKGKPDKKGKDTRFELIAQVYDNTTRAAEQLTFVKELQHQQHGALKILNSAILVKDANGKMTVTETGDLTPKKGAIIGSVTGGLLGALAGPVGIIIGAAAGAGIGRASTKWIDLGLPDDFLQRLQGYLQPNTSALVLIVEHAYVRLLSDSLAGTTGIIMQHTLNDTVVEQLLAEQAG